MNNDSNDNRFIGAMREMQLPEVDLAGRVMQRIHALHTHDRRHSPSRGKLQVSRVWIVACALLLIAAASVSASTLFQSTWNGVQIYISDFTKSTAPPVVKQQTSYKQKLEAAMSASADVWKVIPEKEASSRMKFQPVRPGDRDATLVQSFGVVPLTESYRVKSAEEWWLGGFYDIWKWKQGNIVVTQNLDTQMTETLQNPEKTMSLTFHEADWTNVQVTDDTLAMFRGDGMENLLLVEYKTPDLQVISMEFRGAAGQDDLVKLAKKYVNR